MDTVLQEALCDKNWVHNPAEWGIAFFSPDSTGWLDLTVNMHNALRANFSWNQIGPATTEDEQPKSGELGNTAGSTASTPLDQKTKTYPRQHPYLGIVQVFGRRLVFEPSVFPDLEDWADEYSTMVTAGKFHQWKSFYNRALEDFEVGEPLKEDED
ncbi:hypothetical protein MCOR25_008621 [Pyricularia grisea]|nr:hypothetical protein MCOR25_008621 [Pyricularia grisea]